MTTKTTTDKKRMAKASLRPPRTLYAAYVGMSSSQGISLHADEISALLVIADTLGLLSEDEDSGKVDPTVEALRLRIENHCLQGADDWYVQEVEIP